jgi:hypothetical protein
MAEAIFGSNDVMLNNAPEANDIPQSAPLRLFPESSPNLQALAESP